MTDKSVYGGLFQDPPCLHTDLDPKKTDPYVKEDCIPSRYLGKQMMTGGAPPPGQHPDAYIDHKYLTLASPEQNNGKTDDYANADSLARREAIEAKKKNITEKVFQYSSTTKKSTGPGSYYGCFQERPFEYMTEPWDDGSKKKKRKKRAAAAEAGAEEKTHLPNIKTNPAKKGTYGYPGLTLGKETYNDNWRSDLEAEEKAEAKRKAREAPASKPIAGPFHTFGTSQRYLDELPATGASGVYTEYVPPEDKKAKKRKGKQEEAAAEGKPVSEKPFVFSPRKTGEQGNINAFPNVWIDPDEAEQNAKKGKKRHNKKKEPEEPKPLHGVWIPNSFEKTSVVSSCLRRFY